MTYEVGPIRARVILDTSGVKTQLQDVKAEVEGVEGADSKITWKGIAGGEKACKALSSTLTSAGKALTVGVTAPLTALGAASIKTAIDMDTSLTNVKKTVDGTAEQYQALKDAAVEFSLSNGVRAADLLDVESLGAQLGYTLDLLDNGKSEIQEFGEVVSGLDIATNMDAETAGTELAQFFNIMGEGRENTERYASTIVDLGNHFATTEADVSAMAMRIAGAGKNIGLTSPQVLGLATALTSLGINAEAGGTAISTVMSEVDKSVAMQDENLSIWAETAQMSVADFTAAWQTDAVGALDAVFKGMQQNVDEGGNLSLMLDELGISSIRQTDMMKRLANSGDLMSEAVARANTAWDENTALSEEVANRNDSLEAKFQMLQNKLIAVADQIGGPLADALLSFIDNAQPLIDWITEAAEGFAEMDAAEQQQVVGFAAMAAAAGPLSMGLGKIIGVLPNLAKGAGVASKAVSGLADKALTALFDMGGKASNVAVALSGSLPMIGAIAGAAAITLGPFIADMAAWAKHAEVNTEATRRMADVAGDLPSAADIAAGSMRDMGAAAGEAGEAVDTAVWNFYRYRGVSDEAAEANIKLADEMSGMYGEAGADAALIQIYADRIETLAGNCNGSREKLAELQAAIDEYNELTGSSIGITDDFTGAINMQRDAFAKNTEAALENAYAQAAGRAVEAAADRVVELQQQVAEAEKGLDAAREFRDQAQAAFEANPSEATSKSLQDATEKYEAQAMAVGDLRDRLDEAEQAMSDAVDYQTEMTVAAQDATEAARIQNLTIDDYAAALEEAGRPAEDFQYMADNLGMSVDGLAQKLKDAGIDAGEFASIGQEEFARFATEANGDFGTVAEAIGFVNQMGIDPKTVTVNDRDTITAGNHVINLNKMTIDDKPFAVSDEGTILTTDQALVNLGEITIGDKTFAVSADTTSAYNAINGFASWIAQKTFNVKIGTTKNAQGGFFIPRHASGAIVTRPWLTQHGIVGEAGAEAIVPLDNPKYVGRFSDALAASLLSNPRMRSIDWYSQRGIYDTAAAVWPSGGAQGQASPFDASEIVSEIKGLRKDLRGLDSGMQMAAASPGIGISDVDRRIERTVAEAKVRRRMKGRAVNYG